MSRGSHDYRHKPRGVSNHAFKNVYWPYLPLILVIGVLLSLNAKGGTFTKTAAAPASNLISTSQPATNAYLADANQERQANHENSLSLNGQLQAAAQAKASDMAIRNYWSHDTPEGNPPWIFPIAEGYSYQKLAENLAAGFSGPQAVTAAWMASPAHRANLLDSAYTEAGFGVAYSPDYTSAGKGPMFIVVAYFGRPAGLGPTNSSAQSGQNVILTANSSNHSLGLVEARSTDHAQLAAAFLAPSNVATYSAITIAILAVAIWLGRHSIAAGRAVKRGEHFVLTHPLADVCLIIIAVLAFLLIRTAGFIQ